MSDESQLHEYRQRIDQIDDQIQQLLTNRAIVVESIKKIKKGSVFRPAREDQMLARLYAQHQKPLSFNTIYGFWRCMISSTLAQEGNFKIGLVDPTQTLEDFWQHFGQFHQPVVLDLAEMTQALLNDDLSIVIVPWNQSVIQTLIDQTALQIVGILPMLDSAGNPPKSVMIAKGCLDHQNPSYWIHHGKNKPSQAMVWSDQPSVWVDTIKHDDAQVLGCFSRISPDNNI